MKMLLDEAGVWREKVEHERGSKASVWCTKVNFHMSTEPTFDEIGYCLRAPAPSATTDYSKVAFLKQYTPNVHNAWTHGVEVMAKAARSQGKRTLFGKDKGAKAYDEFLIQLEVVVRSLYADGLASPDSTPEDVLYQILKSLTMFKGAYPNWEDAYDYGYRELFEGRESALRIVAAMQHFLNVAMMQLMKGERQN